MVNFIDLNKMKEEEKAIKEALTHFELYGDIENRHLAVFKDIMKRLESDEDLLRTEGDLLCKWYKLVKEKVLNGERGNFIKSIPLYETDSEKMCSFFIRFDFFNEILDCYNHLSIFDKVCAYSTKNKDNETLTENGITHFAGEISEALSDVYLIKTNSKFLGWTCITNKFLTEDPDDALNLLDEPKDNLKTLFMVSLLWFLIKKDIVKLFFENTEKEQFAAVFPDRKSEFNYLISKVRPFHIKRYLCAQVFKHGIPCDEDIDQGWTIDSSLEISSDENGNYLLRNKGKYVKIPSHELLDFIGGGFDLELDKKRQKEELRKSFDADIMEEIR